MQDELTTGISTLFTHKWVQRFLIKMKFQRCSQARGEQLQDNEEYGMGRHKCWERASLEKKNNVCWRLQQRKTAYPVSSIRAMPYPQSPQLFWWMGIKVTKLKQPTTEAVLQCPQVEWRGPGLWDSSNVRDKGSMLEVSKPATSFQTQKDETPCSHSFLPHDVLTELQFLWKVQPPSTLPHRRSPLDM